MSCLYNTSHQPSEGGDSVTLYGCRRDTIERAAPAPGSAARVIAHHASTVAQPVSTQPLLHSAAYGGKVTMGPLEQYAQLRPPVVLHAAGPASERSETSRRCTPAPPTGACFQR